MVMVGAKFYSAGNFGTARNLRKSTAGMTIRLCSDNMVKHLETLLACKLIPFGQTTWELDLLQ